MRDCNPAFVSHLSAVTVGSQKGFSAMNVTSESMRQFAAGCVQWAAASSEPNSRLSILREAHFWTQVADAIDSHIAKGSTTVLPDLRTKLN